MLDWLIIGGGVHGTHLSNVLLNSNSSQPKRPLRIRVLDPEQVPMSRWQDVTSNCGMDYLRSPRVHHIDLPSNSLHKFASSEVHNLQDFYTNPYDRPRLELFRLHSLSVVKKNRLDEIRISGAAVGIKEIRNGLLIRTTNGDVKSKLVLLCIGLNDPPHWPEWAKKVRNQGADIFHVFDRKLKISAADFKPYTLIVGGGLSAVQLALSHGMNEINGLIMLIRKKYGIHQFDSDPGWIGPKNLKEFHKITNFHTRREIINQSRHLGSIPFEEAKKLDALKERGKINIVYGKVHSAQKLADDRIELKVGCNETKHIKVKRIILATGFGSCRPGGNFTDRLVSELNLQCANCDYPIVDEMLRWHPRIFVSGALAELEIGPVARNIIGARLAGKRISSLL